MIDLDIIPTRDKTRFHVGFVPRTSIQLYTFKFNQLYYYVLYLNYETIYISITTPTPHTNTNIQLNKFTGRLLMSQATATIDISSVINLL